MFVHIEEYWQFEGKQQYSGAGLCSKTMQPKKLKQ